MSVQYSGDKITFSDGSTLGSGWTGFKNRIINGDMRIDQRNAGASLTTSDVDSKYSLDRWRMYYSQASKYTVQQNAGSVTPPVGFQNYMGITSTSSYSVTSGDYFLLNQCIEGYNIADLEWGTANAKPVVLSFWVRSSLTGTFGGAIINPSFNRTFAFTYTISSANTWTYVTVPISGCTDGTWNKTTATGLEVRFVLGCGSGRLTSTVGSWVSSGYDGAAGSTSVVGTNGATFYITGVQLEKGSTATSFDYRPYGTELALCQRYYQYNLASTGYTNNSTQGRAIIAGAVAMRTTPTLTITSATGTWEDFGVSNRNLTGFAGSLFIASGVTSGGLIDVTYTSTSVGKPHGLTAGAISMSAEL